MKLRFTYRIVVLALFFCAVFGKQAKGQEFPWSLQYVTNMHLMNPAFVGMWDKAGLLVSTRTNWVGIEGAPVTQYVGYFSPVKNQKSGMGLNLQRSTIGLEKRLSLTGDYSYQVRLDWYNFLRLGLRVGIMNYDNDLAAYQLYPDRVPDPEFIPDIRFYNMTTFGVGGVFYNDHLFISFSIPQIINNTFRVNRNNFYSSMASFKTAYLSGSYVYNVNNDIFIRPNVLMVATIGKPLYFDFSALVYLPLDLVLGVSGRTNGAACFSAQYTFKNNVRIGFAAEYALVSDIRKYQMGTYEFVVGYDLNVAKRRSSRPYYF